MTVLMFSYKRLRSLWWRWHPLEVGNILCRLVPSSPTLRVDDGLSGKPIVLVETSHRYAYHPGPTRIFSIHTTTALRAKMPRVDVPAVRSGGIASSNTPNNDVLFFEESERH